MVSEWTTGSGMAVTSLVRGARFSRSILADEREFLFTHGQIAAREHLGGNIDSVAELELNEIRLSVLQFIKRGRLIGVSLDVGEFAVVIDRRNIEWPLRGFKTVGKL